MKLEVYTKISDLRARLKDLNSTNLGFVPTMGYLHDGHLSLIKEARKMNKLVVVSIFVNPTQFAKGEDFSVYPKDIDRDLKLLDGLADIVFIPDTKEMYNYDDNVLHNTIMVYETDKSKLLCGKFRPNHFQGVLTVVLKLFNIIEPSSAYFGEKDYQQLVLIKDLTRQLNLDIDIIGVPLLRASDGLAMSSRNTYLSKDARQKALNIYKTLLHVKEVFRLGESSVKSLKAEALKYLLPHLIVQYIEFADKDLNIRRDIVLGGDRIFFAGFVKSNKRLVRLIDNEIL